MADLYASVVSRRVVSALQNGVIPWRDYSSLGFATPWPVNAVTGNPYRGLNSILLWMASCLGGFPDNLWLTRRQAADVGAVVRSDAPETVCLIEKGNAISAFSLINASHVDGLIPLSSPVRRLPPKSCDVDAFIRHTGAFVGEFGTAAMYLDDVNVLRLPMRESFAVLDDFYVVALRELTRWTRHEDRLNRDFRDRLGLDALAFEALVADIATGFLSAEFDIRGKLPASEFTLDWCNHLERDSETLLWAVRYAHQAYNYLLMVVEKRRARLLLSPSTGA